MVKIRFQRSYKKNIMEISLELPDIQGHTSLLGPFKMPGHTSVLSQVNSLSQDRTAGGFLPHIIRHSPSSSSLFQFKKKERLRKNIVQANQFRFGSRREQISSTPAVKTEAQRGQKHPRDYGFHLWTAAGLCIVLESKVKHISLKASGLQWSRTEKKLTLARQ